MKNQKAIYGIIGYPLSHSLSPLMHNAAFKELEVDAVYKLFPIKEEELSDFFSDLRKSSSPIFGLNVTVPYKEKVVEFLDTITPFAQRAKAVNTIVINPERKLIGFNTDGPGFLAQLNELQFDIKGKRVAILGAGGTTRAILSALCLIPDRPELIRIYNRSKSRLENLINDLAERMDVSIIEIADSVDDLNIELADILINTTSLGLNTDDDCLVGEHLIHSNLFVYDVIYNPPETKLLKLAHQKGARCSNGLGMLFYQGILAFQHWINIELTDDIKLKMRQSLMEGLSK